MERPYLPRQYALLRRAQSIGTGVVRNSRSSARSPAGDRAQCVAEECRRELTPMSQMAVRHDTRPVSEPAGRGNEPRGRPDPRHPRFAVRPNRSEFRPTLGGSNMRPALFTVTRTGRGHLSTMARPRGGDWLPDEVTDLAAAGVTVAVSLLTDAETAELDLAAEASAAQAAGIDFHRLPTPDRHAPDRTATIGLGRVLQQQLSNGAQCCRALPSRHRQVLHTRRSHPGPGRRWPGGCLGPHHSRSRPADSRRPRAARLHHRPRRDRLASTASRRSAA